MAQGRSRESGGRRDGTDESWVDAELGGSELKDARLDRRLRVLIGQMAAHPGGTIPFVCQDWANTKAAYRFLDDDRVNEAEILEGHFRATHDRVTAAPGPILVLHDTTEFSFKRDNIDTIGKTHVGVAGVDRDGRPRLYTACGVLMHSSLAVTTDGLPLGLAAIKFWSRREFKGTNSLKKSVNPTRVPIEAKESVRWLENLRQSTSRISDPGRCVHIGDRESDIYELFSTAEELGTHFLVRTCVDRLAGDGDHTISAEMAETPCKGVHRIEVRDHRGRTSIASVELKYRRVRVLPPIGKQRRYPSFVLTVLHATERCAPKDRDPIDWKLMTNLPVATRAEAIEKLQWYALRWKIETFHKVLKSGCRAEDSKLRTAERIVRLLAILCIVGWRIFWLTMLKRVAPKAPAGLAFTPLEVDLLARTTDGITPARAPRTPSLDSCILQLARLGGYLNRAGDGPPGNSVIWRGMVRLTDIAIGYSLATEDVGN